MKACLPGPRYSGDKLGTSYWVTRGYCFVLPRIPTKEGQYPHTFFVRVYRSDDENFPNTFGAIGAISRRALLAESSTFTTDALLIRTIPQTET